MIFAEPLIATFNGVTIAKVRLSVHGEETILEPEDASALIRELSSSVELVSSVKNHPSYN